MDENVIFTKKYKALDNRDFLAVNKKEIWRYSGYDGIPSTEEASLHTLLDTVIEDLKDAFCYNVCYIKIPLNTADKLKALPFNCSSKNLEKLLCDCSEAIIFAATVGIEIDRYIKRNSLISPSKALMAQAYGAERIEALCDCFCSEIKGEIKKDGLSITPRFSPGYGDLPLSLQSDIIPLLDCSRKIGLSLNNSLLMSPSKSVSAIFGIKAYDLKENKTATANKCSSCSNLSCEYRK